MSVDRKPIVIVESPYAGDVERNESYARAAMHDCLVRGEAPYASHMLYTQPGVLDDTVPAERALGMEAGWTFTRVADRVVVYTDLGVSRGMRGGMERAALHGVPVETRWLGGEWAASRGGAVTGEAPARVSTNPRRPGEPERILASAIHVDDGVAYSHQGVPTGLVVAGFRHPCCISSLHALNPDLWAWARQHGKATQGFITSIGRFVDRKEAAEIALAQGQVDGPVSVLTSEDLW